MSKTEPPASHEQLPTLYVKTYCPWCKMAGQELQRLTVPYNVVNVSRDRAAMAEMVRLSGQSYAPTLVVGRRVLADFGPEELEPFLKEAGLLGK